MENKTISFKEKKKVVDCPQYHICCVIIRWISIVGLILSAIIEMPWYVIITLGIVLAVSFIEKKKDHFNEIQCTFQENCLIIERKNLIDSFGNRTREVFTFAYQCKPTIEYSTKYNTITIRGNAVQQQYKSGNIISGGIIEKEKKKMEGITNLTFSVLMFDGDITTIIQTNSPLRVEKISC